MMERRKGFRFPIFSKILLSTLALSGLLIALSYAYSLYRQSQLEGRGRYLEAYLKRYLNYQEGMGQAVLSVAQVLAEDATLRLSLSPVSPTAAAGAKALGGSAADMPTPTDRAGARDRATDRAHEMHQSLTAKNALHPAIFIVFDKDAKPVFVPEDSPIKADDLRELEAVARVRAGNTYSNKLLLHEGHVYQAAGVPIREWGKADAVGGLVLAVPIERFFEAYKSQSDDIEKNQLRLSLVKGDEVLASVFPQADWDELVEALHPEKRLKAKDGNDTIDIIAYDKQTWDFYEDTVSGYSGSEATSSLGTLYILKTRAGMREVSGYMFAALAGIGLALLVALVLAAWITRPVKQFIRATAEISQGAGDLTKRIHIGWNDELGDLADNLNRLFGNLHNLARDVQNASFQVGASSAEISAASKQMLEGAKDQAVKIEGSTAAVTELSTSIQQVASNAIEATKVAKQSNEAVSSAIESMNHIRQTVDEAADKMQELGESGKRIGNIVEVIRQISEQTSLLALNASIEAAHAGEQGRGFAVVADEVSSLAKRVGQSAKDIEDLIATIKDQTSDAVTTMQTGTREVEAGTKLVSNTLGNLKQIIDVIKDTASAVQEQAIVSDEIARNMDAVQKIANEVVASSEEAVIQGEQLHRLAHGLEESVRGFNLDGARVMAEHGHETTASRPELPARASTASLPPAGAKAATGGRRK
jgi:methyl-accepting chemotaxis protein